MIQSRYHIVHKHIQQKLGPESFYRLISQDQETSAFTTLETEFSKGVGERTVDIVLDGNVIPMSLDCDVWLCPSIVCFSYSHADVTIAHETHAPDER